MEKNPYVWTESEILLWNKNIVIYFIAYQYTCPDTEKLKVVINIFLLQSLEKDEHRIQRERKSFECEKNFREVRKIFGVKEAKIEENWEMERNFRINM